MTLVLDLLQRHVDTMAALDAKAFHAPGFYPPPDRRGAHPGLLGCLLNRKQDLVVLCPLAFEIDIASSGSALDANACQSAALEHLPHSLAADAQPPCSLRSGDEHCGG